MPFEPTQKWLAEVKSRVVELPLARKLRFMRDYQLPAPDAETFKNNVLLGDFFEKSVKNIPKDIQVDQRTKLIKLTANLIINNSQSKGNDQNGKNADWKFSVSGLPDKATPYPIDDKHIVSLAVLIQNNTINSSIAQQVIIPEMRKTGKPPTAIVQEKGLAQVSDMAAIEKFCDEVIAANPGPVADFKAGKAAALNFLKGQVMKLSKGKANPALAGEILERKLKN
jgi:aspartyl-tRNA(Asn)/glutamyl-tRNA(Gln) amidotransferase subunit B